MYKQDLTKTKAGQEQVWYVVCKTEGHLANECTTLGWADTTNVTPGIFPPTMLQFFMLYLQNIRLPTLGMPNSPEVFIGPCDAVL